MKFTVWADERAQPLAFIASGIVFCVVFAYLERLLPQNERLPRRSLLLRVSVVVILAFICAVTYELYVVRQFASQIAK